MATEPQFAIKSDHGDVLAVLKSDGEFIIHVNHISGQKPASTTIWTRDQMRDFRNALNGVLNRR